MNRRGFLRGVIVAPVVAPFIAKNLPKVPEVPKKVVRVGLPVPQWRTLYSGVQPNKIKRVVDILSETNEILQEIPWRRSV